MMEFPGNGFGDFREAAYRIRQSNGSRVSHFVFSDYQIQQGKPALAGLPQTHGADDGIETLILSLKDDVAGLELQLFYTIFEDAAVIVRSSKVINHGNQPVTIEQLASQALDFPNRPFDLIHLPGAWAKERQVTREPINRGIKRLDSKRGPAAISKILLPSCWNLMLRSLLGNVLVLACCIAATMKPSSKKILINKPV